MPNLFVLLVLSWRLLLLLKSELRQLSCVDKADATLTAPSRCMSPDSLATCGLAAFCLLMAQMEMVFPSDSSLTRQLRRLLVMERPSLGSVVVPAFLRGGLAPRARC